MSNLETLNKYITELTALLGGGPAVVALVFQLVSLWRSRGLVTAAEASAALQKFKADTQEAWDFNVSWLESHPAGG